MSLEEHLEFVFDGISDYTVLIGRPNLSIVSFVSDGDYFIVKGKRQELLGELCWVTTVIGVDYNKELGENK